MATAIYSAHPRDCYKVVKAISLIGGVRIKVDISRRLSAELYNYEGKATIFYDGIRSMVINTKLNGLSAEIASRLEEKSGAKLEQVI